MYHNELGLDVSCLPYAKKKHHKKRKAEKQVIKPNGGESIDLKPDIEDRMEFSHWEIDCVVGKEGKSTSLLTLVERKTRCSIIQNKDKTKKSVVHALKKIKQLFGKYFMILLLPRIMVLNLRMQSVCL